MSDWSESDLPNLFGKRALITGGASGIGYETARALAGAGAEVLIADLDLNGGTRAVQRIEQLYPTACVSFAALDLGNLQSVQQFSNDRLDHGQPLDLLFNNAGIQPLSTRRCTADGFELTLSIGHLGHFALTSRLLPLLLAASAPRVVTTSSLVHRKGRIDRNDLQLEQNYEAQRAYNQTKLANMLFARELQRRARLAGANLISVAAHPGVARTGIGSNRSRQGALHWKDHMVSLILSVVMPLLGQDADQGALPLLYAATTEHVEPGGLYGPGGFGEMKGVPKQVPVAASVLDEQLCAWLWETSERLCGVDFSLLNSSPAMHQSLQTA